MDDSENLATLIMLAGDIDSGSAHLIQECPPLWEVSLTSIGGKDATAQGPNIEIAFQMACDTLRRRAVEGNSSTLNNPANPSLWSRIKRICKTLFR